MKKHLNKTNSASFRILQENHFIVELTKEDLRFLLGFPGREVHGRGWTGDTIITIRSRS